MCLKCCRETHRIQPLHRVQHWNGNFFQDAWLYQAGVKLHFGHGGAPCPSVPSDESPYSPASDSGEHDEAGQCDPYEADMSALEMDEAQDPCLVDDALTQEEVNSTADFQGSEADPCWTKRRDDNGNPYLTVVDRSGIHLLGAVWCQCGH